MVFSIEQIPLDFFLDNLIVFTKKEFDKFFSVKTQVDLTMMTQLTQI